MTWALLRWQWKAGLAAGALVMAFAGGYAARGKPPAPAVALREDTASQKASAAVADRKDEKGAARVTTTVEEYGPSQETASETPAGGMSDVQAVEGRARQERQSAEAGQQSGTARTPKATAGGLTRRTVTVEERGPEVITEHAAEQTASAEQSHLSLTVTPAPVRPGWAISVVLDDLPARRLLRLQADRRLFGALWLTAGVVPARREFGLGLRMEF